MSSGVVVLGILKDCITFICKGEGVFVDFLAHEDKGNTCL